MTLVALNFKAQDSERGAHLGLTLADPGTPATPCPCPF